MKTDYYQLPLKISHLRSHKEMPRCGLHDSVLQHIHLICTTAFGELQHDDRYGCIIWDREFDNLATGYKLKEEFKESILATITDYEKRLQHIHVDITISQVEYKISVGGRQVKKLVDVQVNGVLVPTNEPFQYTERFFAGPLSY